MNKILIYGINFYPELVGIGKYTGELAFWLNSKRYKVNVITSPKYFPEWRAENNFYKKEIINDIYITRCPIWVPTNPTGLTRILHLLSFSLTSFFPFINQCFKKPDVIFVVAPSFLCAPITLLSKFFIKKKYLILHIQDFEIDSAFELNLLKGKFVKKILIKLEKFILKKFDLVSTISEKMRIKCILKGVQDTKTYVLPNWIDLSLKSSNDKRAKAHSIMRENLKIKEDEIVILYSGSMSKKQGLELIIKVIKTLKYKEKIRWIFSGEGPFKKKLIEETKNFKNVNILPLQPKEILSDWLAFPDIHLIPQKENVSDLVMPSKLIGILASKKTFITNAKKDSELGNIADQVGYRVKPNDALSFEVGLKKLINDESLRKKLGEKGYKLVKEKFEKNKLLNNFEKHFNYFIKQNN